MNPYEIEKKSKIFRILFTLFYLIFNLITAFGPKKISELLIPLAIFIVIYQGYRYQKLNLPIHCSLLSVGIVIAGIININIALGIRRHSSLSLGITLLFLLFTLSSTLLIYYADEKDYRWRQDHCQETNKLKSGEQTKG